MIIISFVLNPDFPLDFPDGDALWVMFPIPVIENTIHRQISRFFKIIS
jgi:hypothetical protein